MRTYAIFAACCLLLFAGGCNGHNDKPESGEAPSNEVRFGVSSVGTRAGMVHGVDEIKSIGIFGYSTGTGGYRSDGNHTPNLLWNRKATRSATGWEYTPEAYWPTDLTVNNSFFAYSPHSSEFTSDNYVIVSAQNEPGNPKLQYSIPVNNMKNMFDILYAVPRLDKNRYSTDGVNDGMVVYDMKHAMSGIAFVVTGVEMDGADDDDDDEIDNIYHLSYLSFRADRMPVTATLDLGYIPVIGDDYYDRAWGAPLAYGPVSYEFELDLSLGTVSDEEGVVDITAGEIVDPTSGKNLLLFFPKDIDKSVGATVTLVYIHNNVEYWYYIDMPPVYMHSGLVTVFLVTLSLDGITVQFRETNLLDDWRDGNPVSPENPGGTEEIEMF